MPAVGTGNDATAVQRQWPRILWWWVGLVTSMELSVIVIVVLCGVGLLDLKDSVLIAYVSAISGGTGILAIVGGLVLNPFKTLK